MVTSSGVSAGLYCSISATDPVAVVAILRELGVSKRTVDADWRMARAWLQTVLTD